MKKLALTLISQGISILITAQDTSRYLLSNNEYRSFGTHAATVRQFHCAAAVLDASLYSLNALSALVKKERYRNKIASFNNPASSDLGFNLEVEIQSALKPILSKAKNTNPAKFNDIIRSFLAFPASGAHGKASLNQNIVYQTLFSLVGSLALGEKRVMKEDVDSFLFSVSKYFVQYEKLHRANETFNESIQRLNAKLEELQFDLREHLLDLVTLLHQDIGRAALRNASLEYLQLHYLEPAVISTLFRREAQQESGARLFPPDALKSAKEIAYGIQKLYNEYQKIYEENYREIHGILIHSRSLSKNTSVRQVDESLRELERLYRESRDSDGGTLRLNTLFERINALVDAGGRPL